MNKLNKTTESKIVKVIDEHTVVINKGERDNIKLDEIFLIYYLSDEEIIDEETGENLGKVENIVGKGRVIHVQEKISTIQSIQKAKPSTKIIKRKSSIFFNAVDEEEIIEPDIDFLPFNSPQIGYLVKKI